MSTSLPVLLFYASNGCGHCLELSGRWPDITQKIKENFPNVRVLKISAKDNSGNIDGQDVPIDLQRTFARWFPMILFVPGPLWDAANENKDKRNPTSLRDGTVIFNGVWTGNSLEYIQKYSIKKTESFIDFVRDALENEDFKRVQNKPPASYPGSSSSGASSSGSSSPTLPALPTVQTKQTTTIPPINSPSVGQPLQLASRSGLSNKPLSNPPLSVPRNNVLVPLPTSDSKQSALPGQYSTCSDTLNIVPRANFGN